MSLLLTTYTWAKVWRHGNVSNLHSVNTSLTDLLNRRVYVWFRFIQPVRLWALCPQAAFSRRSDKLHSECGVPTLSVPPETKYDLNSFVEFPQNAIMCVVWVGLPTLRDVSMFSGPALVGSGTNMSTFKQHDIILQEEHTPDWYFQSAGLAILCNSQWH